mgnify:CR=1 FL=1
MLKKQVLKVIGETAMSCYQNITRAKKFEVFCRFVDNLAADGRITEAQRRSWTHIF